jgi:cytochrome c553
MGDDERTTNDRSGYVRRLGEAVLVVLGVLLLGGTLFIWSGVYNIGASRDHWGIVTWVIAQLRDQSISATAQGVAVPDLSDPGLAALGAEHYRTGCAACHGVPGEPLNPVYANMLPSPPDLYHAASDYDAGELFTIVHHGLKYTGMPAWPAIERADEVWPVVAFLLQVHREGTQVYDATLAERQEDQPGTGRVALENCVRCHGDGETGLIDDLVPRLEGQSADYLARSLTEYREGMRPSGMMQPIAHAMSDAEINELAEYYAELPAAAPQGDASADALEAGRQIFETGVPAAGVPGCASCHMGANPQFPRLHGQPAAYLMGQLQLWRNGIRDTTGYGAIMASVGSRLSEEQAEAVSLYLSTLPLPRTNEEALQ